ncbi:HlyD family efflux transporter periplasmic adaptor subunit [Clostridium sp. D2Q-14]|uniref:HlyD family efflux transporter periplasmic adaptor subunit n=1 Tax=Anaeromonas gelatinilytica TaxID=2683194 RepID=UPI00193C22F9|nr:HlyD family efflux transporter periplasmic adaptor subunit [Anaeromonas gelatinilytica]MBS4534207.1 HlyD family efflux transporter periplasmic adaptor subunit [Anaeromonas gelatinilytica]
MSKKERERRRKRKKKIRLGIAIVITIYLLFAFLPSFYSNNSDTYLIKKEEIEKSIASNVVVIKNESIYHSKGDGELEFHYDEGDKVGKKRNLANHTSGVNDDYQEEIEKIDKKINQLKEENKSLIIFSDDIDKIDKEIDALNEEISKITDDDEKDKLEEELKAKIEKKNKMTQDSGFVGKTLQELEKNKEDLLKESENNNKTYYSEDSGIVSYQFDGYEEFYSYNNVLNMKPKDIKLEEKSIKNTRKLDNIEHGQPIMKVIDDFKWYILANVSVEKSKNLNKGDSIRIRVKDDSQEIQGEIVNLKSDKENTLVLIELNSYLYKYYKERFLEVEIILRRYEGLKIPSKAIVKKDGLKGVYTKNIDSIINFKPVKILYQDDEFVIADQGQRGMIQLKKDEEKYNTVESYDEVIINGNLIDKYLDE